MWKKTFTIFEKKSSKFLEKKVQNFWQKKFKIFDKKNSKFLKKSSKLKISSRRKKIKIKKKIQKFWKKKQFKMIFCKINNDEKCYAKVLCWPVMILVGSIITGRAVRLRPKVIFRPNRIFLFFQKHIFIVIG